MKSVLILEDDVELCEMLGELFVYSGCPLCKTINSVKQLLEIVPQLNKYQVALLDINLGWGVPDGIEACRILQANGFKGEIIFLTGHADGDKRIDDFIKKHQIRLISKPAPSAVLIKLIQED